MKHILTNFALKCKHHVLADVDWGGCGGGGGGGPHEVCILCNLMLQTFEAKFVIFYAVVFGSIFSRI